MLMPLLFLVLDDLMSGWCPKASKLGWLPNFTHKPRKPVPLLTMLNNYAEWNAGTIVYNDIVQNSEQQ